MKEENKELIREPEFSMFIKENINGFCWENKQIIDTKSISDNEYEVIIELIDETGEHIIQLTMEVSCSEGGNSYKLLEMQEHDVDSEVRENKLKFDIDYWSYNITYDQLSRLYEQGKIKIPDMQRGYVWEPVQASKLIESIYMGLPLPSLFLIKQEDGTYIVVDGLQRITTIASFRFNKSLPNQPGTEGFSLKGVNKKLVGKTYGDLKSDSELLDRFDMGTINVIEFKQNKPDYEEAMYFLFERLNSGGTTLTDQQIRNSISYGLFNDELNNFSKKYLNAFFSTKDIENLKPSEVLLRAIAIHDFVLDHKLKNIPLDEEFSKLKIKNIVYKTLLNKTAEKYHFEYKKADYSNKITFGNGTLGEEEFKKTVDNLFVKVEQSLSRLKNIFGNNVFQRIEDDSYKSRLSPTIFESLMVTLMLYQDDLTFRNDTDIKQKYREIFIGNENSQFDLYFTQGTGQVKNVLSRIKTMKEVVFDDN